MAFKLIWSPSAKYDLKDIAFSQNHKLPKKVTEAGIKWF